MSNSGPPAFIFQLCRSLGTLLCLLVLLPTVARSDGAHPDPGYLHQTVLVILRFPPEGVAGTLSANDESYINSQLSAASDFIWTNSNQSLRVTFAVIKIEQSLLTTDYEKYPAQNQQFQYAASYNATVNESLARRLVNPRQYAGVVMIYYNPSNPPGSLFANTWIYFNDQLPGQLPGVTLNPGFTSIVYMGQTSPPLSQFIVHEYCHQLHHRFQNEALDPAEPVGGLDSHGFIDSDWMTEGPNNQLTAIAQALGSFLGITFQYGDDEPWLAAILKYYVAPDARFRKPTLHAVNYRWLEGRMPDNVVLGVFNGGELKQKYDFANSDDVLVHVSGDNITRVNPPHPIQSPASFWFRAEPGHTAAFATQTGFGRYLLKQVAFQYQIAPGDYTFQVHLVYYDNKGTLVNERIDDGIYTLGHHEFVNNTKVINLPFPREVEDFQIVFQKGNELTGAAANHDWVLLGNLSLETAPAP
jgi:hypothetical protein